MSGIGTWLSDNWWWLALSVAILVVLIIIFRSLGKGAKKTRLQRDALERYRNSLLHACRATRSSSAKSVWISGGTRDPAMRLGRYKGHHRGPEAIWVRYSPGLLRRDELLLFNPADLASALDTREVHVKAISVSVVRDFCVAVPDPHDARERDAWAKATGRKARSAEEFVEAWKTYYQHVVDNGVSLIDASNAIEDRSYLRQEVTRSRDELTETIAVPEDAVAQKPEAKPPKA